MMVIIFSLLCFKGTDPFFMEKFWPYFDFFGLSRNLIFGWEKFRPCFPPLEAKYYEYK